MEELQFQKMHGCGNHFIVSACSEDPQKIFTPEFVQKICSKHFGVGSDGFLVTSPILSSTGNGGCDAEVTMFNPDGSVMGMCGNGIRCIARFYDENLPLEKRKKKYNFLVHGREISTEITSVTKTPDVYEVTAGMGIYSLDLTSLPVTLKTTKAQEVVGVLLSELSSLVSAPCTLVSMGNPHAVFIVDEKTFEAIDLEKVGSQIEHHEIFPKRTNVEFVLLLDRKKIKVKVWERGAGATLACGTGACAAAVTTILSGDTDAEVEVVLPGGSVFDEVDIKTKEVILKGPAENVFEGKIVGIPNHEN